MKGLFNEDFVEVMHRAYKLEYTRMPQDVDLLYEQNIIQALAGIVYWLQKEYQIFLVVKPDAYIHAVEFSAEVFVSKPPTEMSGWDLECTDTDLFHYPDWVTAYIEGLKVCLDLVEQIKKQNDGTKI